MANSTRIAGVNPLAIEQASLLDDVFFDNLDIVFQADMIKKLSPVVIYNEVSRLLKDKADIVQSWPKLGSGRTEDGEVDVSCNNPDWTKTLNGKRTVWVSYFDTLVLRSARCMAVQAEIDNLTDLFKNTKDIGKQLDLEAEIATLNEKVKTYKATFRKGIKLLQQVTAQQDYYPTLVLRFSKDTDGNVKTTAKPIGMWPQENPLKAQNFTVSEFNALDFEVARQLCDDNEKELSAEEQWEVLIATALRGTPDEENEEDPDNIEINNFKRFETGAASMLHWFSNQANVTKILSTVDKGKIDDTADMIRTLVELSDELAGIANHLRQPRKGGKGSLYEQAVDSEADTDEAKTIAAA